MSLIIRERIVSLSRNISEYPFTNMMDKESKTELCSKISDVLETSDYKLKKYELSKLERSEILSLLESFYISSNYADDLIGKALYISEDKNLCVLINGENHIKIISKSDDKELSDVFEIANSLDDYLSEKFDYAFSSEYGYLTPNIAMLGNGMKASVIMHLPALKINNSVNKVAYNLSKLGLLLKPLYGSDNKSFGDIYSLSNSVTLGITEKNALDNLNNISNQIINQEESTRGKLVEKVSIQDTIYRSLGILQNARIIDYTEALNLLSNVRFGVSCNLIDKDIKEIDKLIFDIQPVNLINKVDELERINEVRADKIRDVLNK